MLDRILSTAIGPLWWDRWDHYSSKTSHVLDFPSKYPLLLTAVWENISTPTKEVIFKRPISKSQDPLLSLSGVNDLSRRQKTVSSTLKKIPGAFLTWAVPIQDCVVIFLQNSSLPWNWVGVGRRTRVGFPLFPVTLETLQTLSLVWCTDDDSRKNTHVYNE